MNDDYVCIGFGTAGDIIHWSTGDKDFCQLCAKQIRSHCKSVRIVDWDTAQELNEKDREMRFQQIYMMYC